MCDLASSSLSGISSLWKSSGWLSTNCLNINFYERRGVYYWHFELLIDSGVR